MTTTPSTAGSATGIDLAALTAIQDRLALAYRLCLSLAPKQAVGELLETATNMPEWETVRAALARATPQHPDTGTEQTIANYLFKHTNLSAESSASAAAKLATLFATPQHSVTEQASIDGDALYRAWHKVGADVAGLNFADFAAALDRPLASTAATQPEQARIDKRESIADNHDAMIILMQDYPRETKIKIVDAHTDRNIRAALAIPASTAPTQQENEQANVAPPTRGTDSQHDASELVQVMRKALEDIAQRADAGCGCSFPCRCNDDGAEVINAGVMRGIASDTLVEVDRRFRAQGGSTNNGSAPASTAASEQPPVARINYAFDRGIDWLVPITSIPEGTQLYVAPVTAASEQQASVNEADIHLAKLETLVRDAIEAANGSPLVDQSPEPWVKARTVLVLIENARAALSGRATIPSEADERPELTVWYGPMPESNGKSNFTAVLMRKDTGWDGPHVTIERGEYPDRIRYEADRVRHLIGDLSEKPDILAYDANKHSGYMKPDCAAAPDIATTAADQQGDTASAERCACGTHTKKECDFAGACRQKAGRDKSVLRGIAPALDEPAQQGAAQAQAGEEARDAARWNYIYEHATTNHGGNGFLLKCFVPVDEEDMGVGIDRAIAAMAVPATSNGGKA